MHLTYKISLNPFPGLRAKTFSVALAFALLCSPEICAQLQDDFSDGDLTMAPSWQGMRQDFVVNTDLQLQLNATAAGSSWLSTEYSPPAATGVFWEFWIKQAFAPSGANFGRIYLVSDQADLTSALNGYYLQLGEAGSGDAIQLFRQSGITRESVCRARSGAIASSFEARIKVLRDASGHWQVWIDYSGGHNFVMEAEATDDTHMSGAFFGISCTYTVSNAAAFYFDDISIGKSLAPDNSPPEIDSLQVVSSTTLRLDFSEKLDTASMSPFNYRVEPRYGHPQMARANADGSTVLLTFANPFENGYHGTLSVDGLRDLEGNELSPVKISFQYFVPMPIAFNDVIITEIYADPTPQIGLPAHEFAEIFNRSPNPVQLQGWRFSDGASTGRFPGYLLMPGHYVIVCAPSSLDEYEVLGPAVSMSNFATLNNDADRLLLADSSGRPIDSVHYSIDWYKDDDKSAGGWTLERIDTEDLCSGEDNWIASTDVRGGTPGQQNSVYASRPDNMGPKLMSVAALAPTLLKVTFDEQIENAIPTFDGFIISPHVAIRSIVFPDGSLESLLLHLAGEIIAGQRYSLKVVNVYDCPGNRIQEAFSTAAFVLPQRALRHDIIVNEILFHPGPMGVDFVEIYNRSDKTIDLKGWSIRNSHTLAGKNQTVIEAGHSFMSPNEYRVFTEDAPALTGRYIKARKDSFIEMDLPGFNDDKGSAVLVNDSGEVIDSMYYAEDMHSPFLAEHAGVSLERISFWGPSAHAANWASAASDAHFATPGYVNSNMRADLPMGNDAVEISPEIIQPGGAEPFTRISYQFHRGGFIANVKIFDQEGRTIRNIAGNQLLGTEGFFRWDGDRDNGSMVRMGYYFVWFEIFDAAGLVKTYKKPVAVY